MANNTVVALLAVIAVGFGWFSVEKRRRRSRPMKGGIHLDIFLPHQSEFELYSNPFSHCSRKVRLVLAELGIPYRRHDIDLIETGWYQTISPPFLLVNPAGQVPVLVHNGHPIYESDDILTYAATHAKPGSPSLIPGGPAARAEVERWLDLGNLSGGVTPEDLRLRAGRCIPSLTMPLFTIMIRHISYLRIIPGFLFHPHRMRPTFFFMGKLLGPHRMIGQAPLLSILRGSRDAMIDHLSALEAHLADGREWLAGEQFSIADVSWAALLLRLDETAWLNWFEKGQELGRVRAYYERLRRRPSWQSAIASQPHPLVERGERELRVLLGADPAFASLIYA